MAATEYGRYVGGELTHMRIICSPLGLHQNSFKTNNTNYDDNEAFARFIESWKKVAKEVTGKEPSRAEAARWQQLADVLITELKIAAARTTISSVPAFLSEHLRRRLWKKDKQQLSE